MNDHRRRQLVLGVLLMATAALTACNGDGGEAGSTVGSSSPPPTTAAPTTTEQITTTESTATSTTAPTTTQAPTTTIDEITATKAAVAAAAVEARQNYLYAVKNYDAPDALEVLARTTARDSPSWALTLSNIDTLRGNGWLVRDDPRAASVTVVESDVELLDGPPATRAQVTVCTISSGIVYLPGGAPDGSDVIINDEIVSNRNRVTMVLEDGLWKLYEGTGLGSWEATACPAV